MTDPPATGLTRGAGLLLPLFSMPSSRSWGIGEFRDFGALARWMQGAGLRTLQLLPLNEMAPGQNSPYSAVSAMAIDPLFIAVDDVPDFQAAGPDVMDTAMRGMLDHARASRGVDYHIVRTLKDRALRASFRRFVEREWTTGSARARELKAFIEAQSWWLHDYALFRAVHHASEGRSWREWPPEVRDRHARVLTRLRRDLGLDILFRQYLQWIAQTQWQAARADARAAGVIVYGDFPFGVAADSADTWTHQDLFSFDGSVGAPPDDFSADGQNWALPMYRWEVLRARDYAWFGERARRTADLADGFRVDHVVGLFRSWIFDLEGQPTGFVPDDESEQVAQGAAVLSTLIGRATVIAEDLGTIPDFVRETLQGLGIPGYKVLRWERHWAQEGAPFIDPASYPAMSLATSGTHDTDTHAAWWESLGAAERAALLRTLGYGAGGAAALPDAPFVPVIRDTLIESLYASGSALLTLPIQDVFGWTDRINVPGTVDESNWTWKLPWTVDALDQVPEARERQAALRQWAERHGRLS